VRGPIAVESYNICKGVREIGSRIGAEKDFKKPSICLIRLFDLLQLLVSIQSVLESKPVELVRSNSHVAALNICSCMFAI
jgi:hypothetical protein